MKSTILAILLAIPSLIFGQTVQYSRYDSEHTANHIIMGHVKMYCQDTVDFVVEKKGDRWVTSYLSPERVKKKVEHYLNKGAARYSHSTTMGYTFFITIEDENDETVIYHTIKVHVDMSTQKIDTIEIQRN
jgi:hypothetical protein